MVKRQRTEGLKKELLMRSGITIFFIVILCASSTTAQDQNDPKRTRYVIIPSDSVVLAAASQPDCPIVIEDIKLLNPVDGSRRAAFQYQLKNRGTKPVRYVSVYALDSAGTGGGPLYNGHVMDKPLVPGQKLLAGEQSPQIVELTPELRERLKLSGPLRVIVTLLVAAVEYTDGSVFDDRKTVKALGDYFTDINSAEINSKANPNDGALAPQSRRALSRLWTDPTWLGCLTAASCECIWTGCWTARGFDVCAECGHDECYLKLDPLLRADAGVEWMLYLLHLGDQVGSFN
jgi:hypothetical protein